jgi:hypothetical protein
VNKTSQEQDFIARLRSTELNPLWAIGGGVLLVALIAFLAFVRPAMDADRARREWISPEAAAARSPEGRKVDPAYQAAVQAALQKEGRFQREPRR